MPDVAVREHGDISNREAGTRTATESYVRNAGRGGGARRRKGRGDCERKEKMLIRLVRDMARPRRASGGKLTRESPRPEKSEKTGWRGEAQIPLRCGGGLLRVARLALDFRATLGVADPGRGVGDHGGVLGLGDRAEANRAVLPAPQEEFQLGQVGNVAEVPERDLVQRPTFDADAVALHDVLHI